MKNSKEYKDWHDDLTLLTHFYDIESSSLNKKCANINELVSKAETSLLARLNTSQEDDLIMGIIEFIKTSGATLLKLYELLKLALDNKMISIDEYHLRSSRLDDLSYTIENFLIENNIIQNDAGETTSTSSTVNSFWTLN